VSGTTLQIIEGEPESRPRLPARPGLGPSDFSAAAVWQRIEQWIAWRWGARACTFIVEGGGGSWRPPLVPFVTEAVEGWDGEAWVPVTLPAFPLGGVRLGSAPFYRFSGTLGSSDAPPADVAEAYHRLADHFAAIRTHSPMLGSSRHEQTFDGGGSVSIERAPTWTARAIINSGAADLLRPWRRAP